MTRLTARNVTPPPRCPICLDDFQAPEVTPCGHLFCKACIRAALYIKKQCPVCRQSIPSHRTLCAEPACSVHDTLHAEFNTWACASCTLINPVTAERCVACTSRGPATAPAVHSGSVPVTGSTSAFHAPMMVMGTSVASSSTPLTGEDCGQCMACLDKPKFGGPGIKRKGCLAKLHVTGSTSAFHAPTTMMGSSVASSSTPLTGEDCGQCMACLDKPKFGGPDIKRKGCLAKRTTATGLRPAVAATMQPMPQTAATTMQLLSAHGIQMPMMAMPGIDMHVAHIAPASDPPPPNASGDYTCLLCRKVFKRAANLIFHMTEHRPQAPPGVPTIEASGEASASAAGNGPVKCTDCDKEFATKHQAKKHVRLHRSWPWR